LDTNRLKTGEPKLGEKKKGLRKYQEKTGKKKKKKGTRRGTEKTKEEEDQIKSHKRNTEKQK